ncbi:micrococcal nuclease-like nuclease [Synechococcus sp. PCC 7502]|uniref:thermonuclease family protein n=1 Tax=Synechococcus sp. PCC 7502 TaxID=1173263 RepID=UPI00029F8666|nr:thermonuclease family protein [Synechococcus sp. PCC 7502]AFY72475.1 micrococcal nuclease-like nuclease [Synechococcus sp. PCC 7502]
MPQILVILLVLITSVIINCSPAWAFNTVKFYDGDNITIIHEGIKAQVHLACIDAPELKQVQGQKARKVLKALVENQPFELNILGRDRIGRFVAEIISDRGNINKLLVEQGYAEFYNPSGKGCEGYSEAQKNAQEQRLGIWARGTNIQSPQEFRKEGY